jgi:gallate decarboxylase subunit D
MARCACVSFSVGAGRHRVWGSALFSVGGVSVNLLGGDTPHIGAVAVAIPRASRARPGRRSATTSVFALVGHKDDELARSMASDLARHLAITAVVTAGVHLRQARPSDIAAVVRNAMDAVKAILARVPWVRRRTRSES